MIWFLAAMKNTIKVCGFTNTQGFKVFQKKGMHEEARGSKWIEQIIHQCTLDQNISEVADQVVTLIRVF